jgi:hypothetical protein
MPQRATDPMERNGVGGTNNEQNLTRSDVLLNMQPRDVTSERGKRPATPYCPAAKSGLLRQEHPP